MERIEPQPAQIPFLKTNADIAIFGGSAGGGKTYALLLDHLRWIHLPNYSGVIFRRTYPEITNAGGLWDESLDLYTIAGGSPRAGKLQWVWPNGAKVTFHHLQHDKDVYSWQGSQVPLFSFDELTHFTEKEFFYMLSRGRSNTGIRPYLRGGTNPDATSWVKQFLSPWLDRSVPKEDRAQSGELRYFARIQGKLTWVEADWRDEDGHAPTSVTFIRSSVYDNPALLAKNPKYLSNLKSLPPLERARLLDGDWDVVATGNAFKRDWFRYWTWASVQDRLMALEGPNGRKLVDLKVCRIFMTGDLAASTKETADYTVFAAWAVTPDSDLILLDMVRGRWDQAASIAEARKLFLRWAPAYVVVEENGLGLPIVQAMRGGLLDDDGVRRGGLPVRGVHQNRDKLGRAGSAIVRCEAGQVYFPADAPWVLDFEAELLRFPDPDSHDAHDDQVDNLSLAAQDTFWAGGRPTKPVTIELPKAQPFGSKPSPPDPIAVRDRPMIDDPRPFQARPARRPFGR